VVIKNVNFKSKCIGTSAETIKLVVQDSRLQR